MPGTLYVVATPIGKLEDITLRAARVLGEVSLIAAEDTRQTRKLLTHLGLHTRMLSYNEHNAAQRTPRILRAVLKDDVALVSDAGVPIVSDPGAGLVRAAAELAAEPDLRDDLLSGVTGLERKEPALLVPRAQYPSNTDRTQHC